MHRAGVGPASIRQCHHRVDEMIEFACDTNPLHSGAYKELAGVMVARSSRSNLQANGTELPTDASPDMESPANLGQVDGGQAKNPTVAVLAVCFT